MTQMTKAQRNAVLEAHGYRVNHPNGQRDGHIRAQSGARNQMIMRMITARLLDLEGRVTLTALRAAGVDIDALHAEAEMEDVARHQATPEYRHFAAAVRASTGYRDALDILHAEALREYREVTRAARQADSAAYQRSLLQAMNLNPVETPRAYDLVAELLRK